MHIDNIHNINKHNIRTNVMSIIKGKKNSTLFQMCIVIVLLSLFIFKRIVHEYWIMSSTDPGENVNGGSEDHRIVFFGHQDCSNANVNTCTDGSSTTDIRGTEIMVVSTSSRPKVRTIRHIVWMLCPWYFSVHYLVSSLSFLNLSNTISINSSSSPKIPTLVVPRTPTACLEEFRWFCTCWWVCSRQVRNKSNSHHTRTRRTKTSPLHSCLAFQDRNVTYPVQLTNKYIP